MSFSEIIKINNTLVGNNFSPFIIAEMACAHNGSVEQAKKLVDVAVNSKADAIQLQFFVADETVTPLHEAYETIKKIEFSIEQWRDIVNYSKQFDINVFVCTYDVPSVNLAIDLGCDGIKLNSSDLSNPEVLRAVSSTSIPFTLGTGASTIEEVKSGLYFLETHGAENVILMYGVQNFPTEIEDLNISRLDLIKEKFPNIPVGFADHTSGDNPLAQYIDLIALGKCDCVLEKHITLDRSLKGIDYQAALEPSEFENYVERMKYSFKSIGSKTFDSFTESDLKYRKFQKKSIVAKRNLQKGEVLSKNDISFIRNKTPGISPADFHLLEGKILNEKILKFENITLTNVK
jgi:sialic acid synthase SpsE